MPNQAASVEAALHAELTHLALEEQQAFTFLLQTSARREACGHLWIFCVDGLACFACLAKVGELPHA